MSFADSQRLVPSMKTPLFVDGTYFFQLPSMKMVVFMDGSLEYIAGQATKIYWLKIY